MRERVYAKRHLGHNISHWGLVATFLWSEAFKKVNVNLYQTKPMRSFYSCGQLSEMGFDEIVGNQGTRLAVNTTGSKINIVPFCSNTKDMSLSPKPVASDRVTFVLQQWNK